MVGISGVVYGLAGASMVLMPRRRFTLVLAGSPVHMPLVVAVPVLVCVFTAIDVLISPNVAVWAHLGGIASGALVALPLRLLPVPTIFELNERLREESHDEQRVTHVSFEDAPKERRDR